MPADRSPDPDRAGAAPARHDDATHDAELRAAAMATSRSILLAQARAERELSTARDALQRQNTALAQALATLQATLEATPVGVMAADLEGRVTLHNQRLIELWNLPPDRAMPSHLADLAAALGRHLEPDQDVGAWIEAVHRETDRPRTLHFQTADGRHIECQAVPMRSHDGCLGVVYNWLDVTERMEAARLRSDTLAAQLASRAKSQFMSRASHELRTPLNAVLGFAQLLELHPAIASSLQASGYVGHIVTAGRHLVSLMDDLLQVSGIEAGALALRPVRLDLSAALSGALALCQPLAAPRSVRLVQDGEVDTWVRVDPTRICQVLINLASNAIKYNREGGTVRATVERSDGRCLVTLEDSGWGMTAEQLAHLFEPFNRLGAERGPTEGTGLGLVITRQLVRQMDGEIGITSTPGRGTTVRLSFPEAADA